MAQVQAVSRLAAIKTSTETILKLPADDCLIVDYIVSLITSNQWHADADPLWGWVIGPPGSFKTEILRPLMDYQRVHMLSSLTAAALVSGYDKTKDENDQVMDMSLMNLIDHKILVFKDFTAVIVKTEGEVRQIFGDLRDAFDGRYDKHFGTVGHRSYRCKFGLIAAVTPAIDKYAYQHVILGERFLSLRVCQGLRKRRDTRLGILDHAQSAMRNKAKWRKSLQNIWQANLETLLNELPESVELPEEFAYKIRLVADIMAGLRAIPEIQKEITLAEYIEPELGTRLVNQLTNLAMAHAAADGRQCVDATDMPLVYRVAYDTLPPLVWRIYRALTQGKHIDKWTGVGTLASTLGGSKKTIRPILNQYLEMDVVEYNGNNYSKPETAEFWRLSAGIRDQLTKSGFLPTIASRNY